MISVSHLSKAYGRVRVVNDVSFDLPKGQLISFIGPNGAGKSTVVNMISRLIDSSKGTIEINGKNLKKWKSKELARVLSVLPQSQHITMKLTVRELVAFGRFPYCGSRPTKEDYEKIDEAIAYMHMQEHANHFIDELSGGQQQRAYIAMVIAQDTEYVLFDEPTNNLDIFHASQTMKLARKLVDELGKTVVMVLHEINFASFYSDYIVAFKDGSVHKAGPVQDIIKEDVLKELYGVDFSILHTYNKPLTVYY